MSNRTVTAQLSQAGHPNGKFLLVVGIIAPVLFAISIVVVGSLRTDYSQFGGAGISELGVGPNAVIWNVGAIIFGLLIIAFAFGLHRGMSQGKSSKIGPALIGVWGVGFVGLGLFPASSVTLSFHQSFALVVFAASILAPFFIARRVGRDEGRREYRYYSLITGIGAFLVLLTFMAGVQLQVSSADLNAAAQGIQVRPQGALGEWAGGINRLFFLVVWLWIEVTAVLLTSGRLRTR
jgi:hypothetical membrane protein